MILNDNEMDLLTGKLDIESLARAIEAAVLAKLCAGVEMPDFYEVLRQGYIDEAGERFVCLTKCDSLSMADIIEPLFKTVIAAARVRAWVDAEQACKKLECAIDGGGNSYFRPADARECVEAIRALKGTTP